jgi:hypothetical protein
MLKGQTSERLEKLFEGFVILNATITQKNRIIFITKDVGGKEGRFKDDAQLETDFMLYNPNYHKDKKGVIVKYWGQGIKSAWGVCIEGEKHPTIFCDRDISTCEFISDEQWLDNTGWKELPPPENLNDAMLVGTWGVKKIETEIYLFGRFRKLYIRTGLQQWQDLTYEAEHPNLHAEIRKRKKQKKSMIGIAAGFLAVDGFSKIDIYGGGNGSDLWHYDGVRWQRLDPPGNFNVKTILCALDGFVYAAGALGSIIKGRYDKTHGEKWETLDSPINEIIHSLAWFKGKVYIGVEYGLYTIDKEGKVEEYRFPDGGPQQYSFRNVTSCEEALLSYGTDQALVFDGTEWEHIVGNLIVNVPEELS